jgi:hypothetical protein
VSREEYERLAWEFEVMRSRLNGLVNVVQALTGFVDTSPRSALFSFLSMKMVLMRIG